MKDHGDAISRTTVTDTVQKHEEDMHEKEEGMEEVVEDIETIRQTIAELEFGGTSEGADDVQQNITSAEETAVDVFEREDQELEEVHTESQEFGKELEDRKETATADRERISGVGGAVKTPEAADLVSQAEQAAEEDIEFLDQHLEQAVQAFETSEQAQTDYRSRVHSGGGK